MKIKIFVTLLLGCFGLLNAQGLYERHNVFNVIFDGHKRINPYYLSGNPAYLRYDGYDERLSIEGNYSNEEGDFKKFFQPGTERLYNLYFSGKKSLNSEQIFKGLFSLQRLERYDWNWLAVKDYDTGSPFLFGDSTSGKSRYSGILMNAQYSIALTPDLYTGFSFTYNVDEGLKQIAPRPTSDHRNIDFTLGGAYSFSEAFSVGISFHAFDYLEEISYKEDEGSVNIETILFKIRGFDYPLRISKKVETRVSFHNNYFLNTDYFYESKLFTAAAFLGGGFEQINIKEDLSNPRNEGFWNNDLIKAGLSLNYTFNENISAGFSYKIDLQDMWAKHPNYEVIIMDDNSDRHEAALGSEYKFSESLACGLEFSSVYNKDELKDYHGNTGYKYSNLLLQGLAGIDFKWNETLVTFLALGGGQSSSSDAALVTESPTVFYLNSRYNDYGYFRSDYIFTRIDLNTEIRTSFPGIIKVYLSYLNTSVKEGEILSNAKRSFFNAALELKIKVY